MKQKISLKHAWTMLILLAVAIPMMTSMIWYGLITYNYQLNKSLAISRQANEVLSN